MLLKNCRFQKVSKSYVAQELLEILQVRLRHNLNKKKIQTFLLAQMWKFLVLNFSLLIRLMKRRSMQKNLRSDPNWILFYDIIFCRALWTLKVNYLVKKLGAGVLNYHLIQEINPWGQCYHLRTFSRNLCNSVVSGIKFKICE
jgi:hypothetical protein